jgi:hypothetical protein
LIQIRLQFFQGAVDLFSESDIIKFLFDRPVEAFADAVGLRMTGFGLAVVNILNGQIKLVFVMFEGAFVFGPPIRQNPQQFQVLLLILG